MKERKQQSGGVHTVSGEVLAVAVSPRGSLFATASADGQARVWSIATRSVSATLALHTNSVRDVAWSPSGDWVVTASTDRTARVWNFKGQARAVLLGHTGPVRSAIFTPDSRNVVTASDDGTARLWDAGTAFDLEQVGAHRGAVTAASYSSDGKYIVSAGADRTARIYRAASLPHGRRLLRVLRHRGPVTAAAFSPDDTLVATGSKDGARLWRWHSSSGGLQPTLPDSGHVDALAWSGDGSRVITGSADGRAVIWGTDGQAESRFRAGGPVTSVAFARDGSRAAAATADGRLLLVDPRSGDVVVKRRQAHTRSIAAIAFSPDSRLLVTAGDDKKAKIWSARTAPASRSRYRCAAGIPPPSPRPTSAPTAALSSRRAATTMRASGTWPRGARFAC